MDTFNWMVLEMITREHVRELMETRQLDLPEMPKQTGALMHKLASSLVRLGLRLDPAAGEGLGRLDLSMAHTKGGN